LQELPGYSSLEVEVGGEQVRTCIDIATDCTKRDWHARPTMDEIIDKLKNIETGTAILIFIVTSKVALAKGRTSYL
jgi:hypothetical protein